MKIHSHRIASLLLAAGVSCVSAKPERDFTRIAPAERRFSVVEAGPLEVGSPQPVRLDESVPSYRVESYGGTTLDLSLLGGEAVDAYLVVEGPLPGNGDDTAPGSGAVLAQDDDGGQQTDAHLRVVLAEPGVYRVLAGTYETLGLNETVTAADLILQSRCDAVCARPSISNEELLATLRQRGQLEPFAAKVRTQLDERIPDPIMRAALGAQLDAIVSSPDFAGLERWPTIPLRGVSAARPLLGGLPQKAPAPDAVVDGELAELLGGCDAVRALPPPVDPSLPGVGNGHFPNRALPACQVAHSEKLAQILTSLSVGNGSVVRYDGRTIRTPSELAQALIETGHVIEVRNERTYANFISLTFGDQDVRWPVWLDTGVPLDGDAGDVVVPVGHSHHAFRISGPLVDARVMFYLGISGAAFFAQTSVRPAWTGEVARDVTSTSTGGTATVLAALDAAAAYLRRNRIERTTVAAGLPADGYGVVGVCNDSNATVEYATHRTVTTFPLLRAASLDAAPPLGDGLDEAVRTLPHDADVAPERRDALRRILAMTPLPLDSPYVLDELLRSQLVAAQTEIGSATAGD